MQSTAERFLVRHSLNLYDGACWQIACALAGLGELAEGQTTRLLSGMAGDVSITTDNAPLFSYGDAHWRGAPGYFFRTVVDQYANEDPMTGKTVTMMDWKPITGENAWCTMLGPLQTAILAHGKALAYANHHVQLAVRHVKVFAHMQSRVGGVYCAYKSIAAPRGC